MPTLILEDGDGVADANAYIDIDFADLYHDNRGHVAWADLDDDIKIACIIRATDYIDKRFGRKFRGIKVNGDQGLQWPRLDAFDDNYHRLVDVPRDLQKATAEYALRAAQYSELAPDPLLPVPTQNFEAETMPAVPTTPGPGAVAETSGKADVVEESIRYQSPQQRLNSGGGRVAISSLVATGNIPEYPAADMLIEGLLNNVRRLARG